MILFEKHAFKRNFLKLYQELSFRPYSPMRDFFSTGPERLNPFFLPGGDKRLSLPGREWERVLAASPAKPALEKWFGRNICGPELSATMYQAGVSCTRFSLVSWTKAKMGSWACTLGPSCMYKDSGEYTKRSETVSLLSRRLWPG